MAISDLISPVAALAGVIALVLLAARWARSSGLAPAGAGRRLTLLDTLAIDRARRLTLVRCDGREVLLLVGGGRDQVIWSGPAGDAP